MQCKHKYKGKCEFEYGNNPSYPIWPKESDAKHDKQQIPWDDNQKKLAPGSVAKTLKDGTKLCPDFQVGKCKVKKFKCNKGVHKCGRVLKNGRVCGMPYHGANECKRGQA